MTEFEFETKPLHPFLLAITQSGLSRRAQELPAHSARKEPLVRCLAAISGAEPFDRVASLLQAYGVGVERDTACASCRTPDAGAAVPWRLGEMDDLMYLVRARYGR
jgi:hypothetical protein